MKRRKREAQMHPLWPRSRPAEPADEFTGAARNQALREARYLAAEAAGRWRLAQWIALPVFPADATDEERSEWRARRERCAAALRARGETP